MSAVAQTRTLVAELHAELVRNGLAVWTMGNVSARVPGEELIVIKPSGVGYDELTAESMVLVDLDGSVVEGTLAPSSDTATHAYVYRAMESVGGVVHTHSTYATAWAAAGLPIPCVLTGQADEFGGDIPVGPFARIGGEEIGIGIVQTLRSSRSPAVLMRSHGVFTIGASARDAVKAAVMCEDVARTVLLARSLGELVRLTRRTSTRSTTATRTSTGSAREGEVAVSEDKPLGSHEVWFVAGSQEIYGEQVLATVAADAPRSPALDEAAAVPVRVVARGVVTTPEAIRRAVPRGGAADELRRGDHLDAHLLAGEDVDRRAGRARKPLLHLHTQFTAALPWAQIDMDYMNTHQSAHGDREFGFIETRMGLRRKTVVGHWREPATLERVGGWARAACGWHEAARLRVARFGDNMREVAVTEGDKVEAQMRLGVSVNGYGVGDLAAAVDGVADEAVEALVADYEERYELAAELRGGGARRARCSTRRGSRPACARSWTRAARAPSPTPSRTCAGCAAARHRRAAADGGRLRLRRRGRLEDRRAAAARQGDGQRPGGRQLVHGGLHLRPRGDAAARARRAHARDLPLDRGRPSALRDPSALDRRRARIPSGWSSTPPPGPAWCSRWSTSAIASG